MYIHCGVLFVHIIRFTGIVSEIDDYCLAHKLLLYVTYIAGVEVKAGRARTSGGVVGVMAVGTIGVVDHLRHTWLVLNTLSIMLQNLSGVAAIYISANSTWIFMKL